MALRSESGYAGYLRRTARGGPIGQRQNLRRQRRAMLHSSAKSGGGMHPPALLPTLWRVKKEDVMRKCEPYTCRLLIRIDKIIYRIRGVKCFWGHDGKLVTRGSNPNAIYQVNTHFPGWMFAIACKIQNKWFWTRKILSA